MKRFLTRLLSLSLATVAIAPAVHAGFPIPGFKTPTLPAIPKPPATSTPDSGQTTGAPPATGDLDAQAKKLYESLDFATEGAFYRRGTQVVESRGMAARLLVKAKNPDPQWILKWPLSRQDSTADVLIQAAANRTWLGHCEKVFGELWQDAEKVKEEVGPELAAAQAEPNFYARIRALRALVAKVDTLGERGFAADVGVAASVHKALVDAYGAANRGWMAASVFRDLAHGRPARDEATERALFCATAKWTEESRGGVRRLPEMLEEGSDQDVVRWPGASRSETKALEAAAAEAEPAFWSTKPAGASIPQYSVARALEFDPTEPKLVTAQGTVTAITPNGQITITDHSEYTEPYGCVRTNHIVRIENDGTLIYEQKCKQKTVKQDLYVTLTMGPSELPPGIAVQKGDVLSVYADLTADADKNVFDMTARAAFERRGAAVVRSVRLIQRAKKDVFEFN